MTDDRADAEARPDAAHDDDTRGTFFLAIVFLLMVVAAWIWMYATLLGRG